MDGKMGSYISDWWNVRFHGSIDEFRLWTGPLNESVIR